ncbi:uncharacterized protein K444DRAFT_217962 [Hyaloscypha bicolor E]|uniref:Uncharacterized protein n=1 Tax=Hyaloscypha bicolor E TaxID=1095630 RepID=A0A2J6SP08_9HELO|nr:uncharacterized protein K444DRAFT_217962 [Hyaloscypha bicolor E]PMD52504.1 hypothetical protein K444DRAFT_217962 [Hyaloscypha bicolor E]
MSLKAFLVVPVNTFARAASPSRQSKRDGVRRTNDHGAPILAGTGPTNCPAIAKGQYDRINSVCGKGANSNPHYHYYSSVSGSFHRSKERNRGYSSVCTVKPRYKDTETVPKN